MKKENFEVKVMSDGYNILHYGKIIYTQKEPFIPYPDLGYKGSGEKQIEEMIKAHELNELKGNKIKQLEEELTEAKLEQEQAMAELTMLISGMMGGA